MKLSSIGLFFLSSVVVFLASYGIILYFKTYYNPMYDFEKQENNHGVFREYYFNGNVKSSEEYYKGMRHGKSVYLFENGDTSSLINYFLGERHGEAKFFTESGQLVIKEIYRQGTLSYHNVENDSLYTYVYKVYDTGWNSFEKACAQCHSSNEEIVEFKDSSLNINRLDTIHLCILDTVSMDKTIRNYFRINQNEMDAMKFFIDQLKESKNEKKQQIRINRNQKKRIVGQAFE